MRAWHLVVVKAVYRSKLWLWKWNIGWLFFLFKLFVLHSLATDVVKVEGPQTMTPISTFPQRSDIDPKISAVTMEMKKSSFLWRSRNLVVTVNSTNQQIIVRKEKGRTYLRISVFVHSRCNWHTFPGQNSYWFQSCFVEQIQSLHSPRIHSLLKFFFPRSAKFRSQNLRI